MHPLSPKQVAEVALAADTTPSRVRSVLRGAPYRYDTKQRTRVLYELRARGIKPPHAEYVKAKPRGNTARTAAPK